MHTGRSVVVGMCIVLSGCGECAGLDQVQRSLKVSDVALASGDDSAALQIAEGVAAQHPDNAEALVRVGNAQAALTQNDAAEGSFHHALDMTGGSLVAAKLGLARIHLVSDVASARREFEVLAATTPPDPKILNDLGVANDLLGDHKAAQIFYRNALSLQPGSVCTQVDLGLSLAMSGQPARAISLLAPLAGAADASPKIRQDYALSVTLAGRTDDARAILQVDLPADQVASAVGAFQALRVSAR